MKTISIMLLVFAISAAVGVAQESGPASTGDLWAPFRPLVGKWVGERTGLDGDAMQTVEWKFVLGNKFLQYATKTIAADDPHADIGMISYDKSRKKFICRAFFSEGYVNQYVGTISENGKTIEFETEAVENGPPGLRVKEIVRLDGDVVKQECLLASGDKPFESCIVEVLKKDE